MIPPVPRSFAFFPLPFAFLFRSRQIRAARYQSNAQPMRAVGPRPLEHHQHAVTESIGGNRRHRGPSKVREPVWWGGGSVRPAEKGTETSGGPKRGRHGAHGVSFGQCLTGGVRALPV